MDTNETRGAFDEGRRRVLSLIARAALGLSAGNVARVTLRTLAGGAATGLAATRVGPIAAGSAPAVLAHGPGPAVDGGTLLRGCSATATAVERFGGRLPPGLAIDFARRTALLLTGLDPVRLAIDSTTGDVAGSPAPAWALVAVDGRVRDLGRSWRIRAAGGTTPIALETNGG